MTQDRVHKRILLLRAKNTDEKTTAKATDGPHYLILVLYVVKWQVQGVTIIV